MNHIRVSECSKVYLGISIRIGVLLINSKWSLSKMHMISSGPRET